VLSESTLPAWFWALGWYFVANNTHAFLRDATGSIVDIDPPDSSFAIATAINDAGVIHWRHK
jgi:hypothetical protein